MSLKRVLIITYYWPPSGGAGVQRWLKFAKYLPEFGWEPIILTVDPEKASFPQIDLSLQNEVPVNLKVYKTVTTEIYNLYKKLSPEKRIPFAGFVNENTSGIFSRVSRFIRGNFFIPDPRKGWNKYAYKKAKEIINDYHITTVITSSPPHSTQLIGLKLKQKLNLKWIADLRDPWTDIYYYKDILRTKIAKRIDSKYEKMVLEIADRIIVVSDSIQERLKAKLDKLAVDKFTIIPNGFDEEDFLHNSVPPKEHFIITYTGTLSRIYRIDSLLRVLREMSGQSDVHIKLRFIGEVSDYIKSLITEKGLDEIVEYIDHVEHAKSIEYLYHSTILLLVIPEVTENRGILTGKIFEYLASQKPILLIGPTDGDAATVVKECEAGEVFDYDMETEMEYYLNKLIQQWLKNPNLDLKTKRHLVYSRKKQAVTLARLLLAVNSH